MPLFWRVLQILASILSCVTVIIVCGASLNASAATSIKGAWSVQNIATSPNQATRLLDKDGLTASVVSKDKASQLLHTLSRIQDAAGISAELWLVQLSDNDPNAFAAISDGKKYVLISLSMLDLLGDEMDAYAFLLGHEIAHLVKQHGTQSQARRGFLQGLGLIASIIISAKTGINVGGIADLGADLIDNTYNRDQEREADELGLRYMASKGFDTRGAVNLQRRLLGASGSTGLPFLSSHPSGEERIANIEKVILTLAPPASTAQQVPAPSGIQKAPENVSAIPSPSSMSLGIGYARVEDTLSLIREQYVDSTFDDRKIVAGCYENIKQHLNKSMNQSLVVEYSPIENEPAAAQLARLFMRLNQVQPDLSNDRKLVDACITGMVDELDGVSSFIDTDDYKDLVGGSAGLGGVGLELGIEGRLPIVVSPIENGPAQRAGIQNGDLIISIDDRVTEGLPLKYIVKQLRGVVGSDLKLTVVRAGVGAPLHMTLTREVIRLTSLQWKTVEPGYGYIRIAQFQEGTLALLAEAITKLYEQNQGNVSGLVLDLRNNSGGLLPSVAGVAATFIPANAQIADIKGRTRQASFSISAQPAYYVRPGRPDPLQALPHWVKSVPLVVLVNRGTASGAEIVAAALQDHKRATILGTPTSANGVIATIIPMKNQTALKLVTGRTFRPNGEPIGGVGITPDSSLSDAHLGKRSVGLASIASPNDPALVDALKTLRERSIQTR